MRILVTGGAGYIGSHAVRALSRAGHQPLILDNLVYGHDDLVRDVLQVPLIVGQVGDRDLLLPLLHGSHPALVGTSFEGQPIDAVIHFAAYAYVGESVTNPAKYYRNNLVDTLTLLEALVAFDPPIPIVFSSTCATYGLPQSVPMGEDHPQARRDERPRQDVGERLAEGGRPGPQVGAALRTAGVHHEHDTDGGRVEPEDHRPQLDGVPTS